MTLGLSVSLLLLVALLAANLPWLTERVLFVLEPPAHGKREWIRIGEWFLLYLIVGGFARGLEYQQTGEWHRQEWEFYAVTLCLFVVLALPGFIYRHDLRRHLLKRRKTRAKRG